MFKMIIDIEDVNYDNLMDQMLGMLKEQEKNGTLNGAKIPPMPDSNLLKKMPQPMKNQMLVAALQMEKKKIIEMMEKLVEKVAGEITIQSFELQAKNEPGCVLRTAITIQTIDYLFVLDKILPFLTKEECEELLGEDANQIPQDQIATYLRERTTKEQEVFMAKSMRIKKDVMIQKAEEMVAERNAYLKIASIRFLVEAEK